MAGVDRTRCNALRRKALAGAILAGVLVACAPPPPPAETTAERPTTPAERGEYLVEILGCGDCHTPFKIGSQGPEPDMARMLSGHPDSLTMPPPPKLPEGPWVWVGAGTNTAFAGPWGVSYASNLTPHEDTGIGSWTEEIFVSAIRSGKHWGQSRPILPPMPWTGYAKMTDEDLKAVYAYLRTIPAFENRVPDAQPAGAGAAP